MIKPHTDMLQLLCVSHFYLTNHCIATAIIKKVYQKTGIK